MKTDIHFNNISLSSSYNEKCFRQNLQRKSKHTSFCVQSHPPPPTPPEKRVVYKILWKNMEDPDRKVMGL